MTNVGGYDVSELETFHVLVPRTEWGALPPKSVRRLDLPARHLRYTFTASDGCHTEEECVRAVQMLQKQHMERGCQDIMYNFLVGGDGRVYEGRGWGVEGELPPKFEDLTRETIDVAFIGNFVLAGWTNSDYDRMPLKMTENFRRFLKSAENEGDIEENMELKYYDFDKDFAICAKEAGIMLAHDPTEEYYTCCGD